MSTKKEHLKGSKSRLFSTLVYILMNKCPCPGLSCFIVKKKSIFTPALKIPENNFKIPKKSSVD